jgi:hypothetical protein
MYLVVWTTRREGTAVRRGQIFNAPLDNDRWEACDTLAEARKRYKKIIAREDTYSASIAAVVDSTDYVAPTR